jgi:hypothetical protein
VVLGGGVCHGGGGGVSSGGRIVGANVAVRGMGKHAACWCQGAVLLRLKAAASAGQQQKQK